MPPKVVRAETVSDNSTLHSFTVSQLFPSRMTTMENGGAGIHSPYATLVAVLRGKAQLMPDELTVKEGHVILIPSTYPCKLMPEESSQMELAAIDFRFKSHGMDISKALPDRPLVISGRSAKRLTTDICIICNSTAATADISRTTEQLASGYRIAHTLSNQMKWSTNPLFSFVEDDELQELTAYLEANFHLPLTIEDIAADCNLSRRKAFSIASRHTCRTPMRILKQIRLERSLSLLRRDDTSIGQAASAVGFGDAKNFSREFKACYGLTPLHYKQQSQLNMQTEDVVKKAEANMQMNRCKRAATLYLQAIDNAPPNTDLNALHYKAGLALKRAGENGKAKDVWDKVTALYYRLLINMDVCESLSKNTHYEQITTMLKRVYDYGDETLRQRAVGQLGKWMLECASSQKQRAAKQYSRLAKELVSDHTELQPSLARTLYSTGQFQDIERYCPDQRFFIAAALRAMGRYQEHLDRFPEMRMQCAMLHLRMGNIDTLFSDYEDQQDICARALIDTGRAEDAVSRYPTYSAEALMALGRYDEILQHHPHHVEMCVFALANMGRESEALEKAAASVDLTSRLLLHLERPHDMTSSPSREFTVQIVRAATVLQAIHVLEKGDYGYGIDILESVQSITDPDYRTGHEYYELDLIVMLIRYVLRDSSKTTPDSRWPSLTSYLCEVVENWRYCYDQRLWYDARFILNDIDESDYGSQPYRLHSESRLPLAKAIKAELNDSQREAVEQYREYLEKLPALSHNYAGGPTRVLKAFIRWRLRVISN